MNNRRYSLILLMVALWLAACAPVDQREVGVHQGEPPPQLPSHLPTVEASFPLAHPLSEVEVKALLESDDQVGQILHQDLEQVAAGPHFENSVFGPSLIPSAPARITRRSVSVIRSPVEQPLSGYIDIAAIVRGKKEHDFLITLFLDYRQVPFELGDNGALAHVVRLPAWQLQVFPFCLLEPLPSGLHELVVVVHDDPYNVYATRGVREKRRRGGKITFDTAAGRPFGRPVALRYSVIVGDEQRTPWLRENWHVSPFQARNTFLLNTPLYLSLTWDETAPLAGVEPAVVPGEDDDLYAFVYYPPPSIQGPQEVLPTTHAALVALLDGQQVRANNRDVLFFQVEVGKRYRFPLRIKWPSWVKDGKIHALYVILTLGVPYPGHEGSSTSMIYDLPYAEPPVMVVPDRSWIDYIKSYR